MCLHTLSHSHSHSHTHTHTALQASDAGAGLWVSDCCQHGVRAGRLWSIECSHLECLPHCDHAVWICSQATTKWIRRWTPLLPMFPQSPQVHHGRKIQTRRPHLTPAGAFCNFWWDRALSQRFLFCLSQSSFGSISVSPCLPFSLLSVYHSINICQPYLIHTLVSISSSIAHSLTLSLSHTNTHTCV